MTGTSKELDELQRGGPGPTATSGTDTPPPPYDEAVARPSTSTAVPAYSSGASSQSPFPSTLPGAVKSYPIYYEAGLKLRLRLLSDGPNPTPVFYISAGVKARFGSKEVMTVYRGGDDSGAIVAHVRFHNWTTAIDIAFLDPKPDVPPAVTLKQDGSWTRRHEMEIAGRRMFWKGTRGKNQMASQNIKLVDEADKNEGETYALLNVDYHMKTMRLGYLEIWKEGLSEGVIEQIVTSAMSMWWMSPRCRGSIGYGAATSAAGAASAGAVVGAVGATAGGS